MTKQNQTCTYKRDDRIVKPTSSAEQKQILESQATARGFLYSDPKEKSAILHMVDDVQNGNIETVIVSSVHKIPLDRATRKSVGDSILDNKVNFVQTSNK